MQRRIKRNYRHEKSPAKALFFCNKVRHALTDNQNFTGPIWGANDAIRQEFFEAVDRLDVAFHTAINGDRNWIRDRDKLWQEIIIMLDGIASALEAACVRNPDALYTTGFDISQERRSPNRTRLPLTAPEDLSITNLDLRGGAVGSTSYIQGAYNFEIHITDKDPSVEGNWWHKDIFPDPRHMEMLNLNEGNTFFRTRAHGPDGSGPWSGIVSIYIT
jgi:hypothetical protein